MIKISAEQAYIYATKNAVLSAVFLAVHMLSRSKIFDVVISLTKGKPLVHRKKSCLFTLLSAPVKYSLKPKDFKYLESASLMAYSKHWRKIATQTSERSEAMKKRSRN